MTGRTPHDPGDEREVMNTRQAAEFLHLSHDYFSRLAGQGKIPRRAVTERNYVYLRSELIEWLKTRPADGRLLDRPGG